MTLIVGIDNVINNLAEAAIELYNSRTGQNIKIEDITTYNFFDCLPSDDASGIVSLFKEKTLWDSLRPLPYSQMSLKQLMENGHKVYLATATDPCNFEWKMQWLARRFPFIPQENVIRIVDKSLLNCDVIIDDCLDNVIGCFCDRVCLDYPWNQDESKDYVYDIRRANNWLDIVNIINQIEKENEEWGK